MRIKKPLIRQAGSAAAFAGPSATGLGQQESSRNIGQIKSFAEAYLFGRAANPFRTTIYGR
jgi:hypothetical protein